MDDLGIPLALAFFPGNMSDYNTVSGTCERSVWRPASRIPLYADKGYDSARVRGVIWSHGYIDRVSKRRVRIHRLVNRRRGIVERFYSWMDKYRRLILRYDSYAQSYESWTWLACCQLLSRRVG